MVMMNFHFISFLFYSTFYLLLTSPMTALQNSTNIKLETFGYTIILETTVISMNTNSSIYMCDYVTLFSINGNFVLISGPHFNIPVTNVTIAIPPEEVLQSLELWHCFLWSYANDRACGPWKIWCSNYSLITIRIDCFSDGLSPCP